MEQTDQVLQLLSQNKGTLILYALIFIAVIVIFAFIFSKDKKKRREKTKKELQFYSDHFNNIFSGPSSKSGNVYVAGNEIYYSRGPKQIKVKADIQRITVLTPDSVAEWFVGRNYNMSEEENILNDIKTYLLENRLCRKVEISFDEEVFNKEIE